MFALPEVQCVPPRRSGTVEERPSPALRSERLVRRTRSSRTLPAAGREPPASHDHHHRVGTAAVEAARPSARTAQRRTRPITMFDTVVVEDVPQGSQPRPREVAGRALSPSFGEAARDVDHHLACALGTVGLRIARARSSITIAIASRTSPSESAPLSSSCLCRARPTRNTGARPGVAAPTRRCGGPTAAGRKPRGDRGSQRVCCDAYRRFWTAACLVCVVKP